MRKLSAFVLTLIAAGLFTALFVLASLAHIAGKEVGFVVLAASAGLCLGFSLTSYRRAALASAESEKKFSTLFRVSPFPMIVSRRKDGRILDANLAFSRYYNLTEQEIIGRTTGEVGVWPDGAQRKEMIALLERDGYLRNYKKLRVTPEGKLLTFLISAEPLLLGSEECILCSGQDVTELLEAEHALARSAEELRIIFETTSLGIILVAKCGVIVRTNPAIERFLGYTPEELCQKTFAQFTPPEQVERDLAFLQKMMDGAQNHYSVEKRYLRKNGSEFWGHLTLSAVKTVDGKVSHVVAMVEDISGRKQAELALAESENERRSLQEQLIAAQKLDALGQLAGGVAHDFNNMLAAIMLHLGCMKSDPGVTELMRESLGELTEVARRASGLTRQLLLFGRREPVLRQVVDLNVIVANLLRMLDRLVGEQYALFHVGTQGPLWLNADPGMLEQVVMNLVMNARDAMPKGGRIVLRVEEVVVDDAHAVRVSSARAGRFVQLTVTDKGCGMSPAVQSRIFEPFFTTKEAGRGTGLGLSTVFGIVQQHQGWIEVSSVEGRGSSFAVYLPCHEASVTVEKGAPGEQPSARGHETILLAEDNESVRFVTARILRQHGYHVLEAEDGRSAKEILDSQPGEIALLLTDVVMPGGLLGHELAAGLPKDGPRPKLILMSGYNAQLDPSTKPGPVGAYLVKPFEAEQLLRCVREALDQS